MLKARLQQDLVQIVMNGGGLELDAQAIPTMLLVQLAANAQASGARLLFRGMGARPTQDLVQIAVNGKGAVVFAD